MESSSQAEPHWKLVQRVVALLEKSLTPDAEVLHDKKLPDITTGHMRQCDVVIKYGNPPRQLVAIVEVQDRAKKVEIGTLGGWVQKKESVGAHQLMCVSALDFPQSVKDQVSKKLGPSTRLLRLRELEAHEWPGSTLVFRVPKAITHPHKMYGVRYGPGPLGPGSKVPFNEMMLYVDGSDEPVTVSDLMTANFDRLGPMPFDPGTYEIDVSVNIGRSLWAEHAGVRQEIKQLVIPTILTIHQLEMPIVMASYEQVDVDGTVAWAATAEGTVDSELIQFRMTFVPDNDGRFTVGRVEVIGAPRGGYLRIPPELLPDAAF